MSKYDRLFLRAHPSILSKSTCQYCGRNVSAGHRHTCYFCGAMVCERCSRMDPSQTDRHYSQYYCLQHDFGLSLPHSLQMEPALSLPQLTVAADPELPPLPNRHSLNQRWRTYFERISDPGNISWETGIRNFREILHFPSLGRIRSSIIAYLDNCQRAAMALANGDYTSFRMLSLGTLLHQSAETATQHAVNLMVALTEPQGRHFFDPLESYMLNYLSLNLVEFFDVTHSVVLKYYAAEACPMYRGAMMNRLLKYLIQWFREPTHGIENVSQM